MADVNNFDFGFTAVDEPINTEPRTQTITVDSGNNEEIMQKLYDLENKLLGMDNSTMLENYKALVEQDVALKLKQAEDMILPLLYNLKKNPEKEYIHWPNRNTIIDNQIEKLLAVTRYYDQRKG
jgi:hypothetical protein